MEVLDILEALEDLVEKSKNVPLSGRCLVDREEILEIVKEIRLKLPDDIKQAKWVKEERQRILLEAQKEADQIVADTEEKVKLLVEEDEITKKACAQASEILETTHKNAKEIKLGTREYAEGVLNKVTEILRDTIEVIESNRRELK
ncbi:MAG: ATPase [Clostridia bacterium]|jgi:vacuolar-type H+-ATPase subunit H